MGRFQNYPSMGWVHPKCTHAHPLAWGNNKTTFIFRKKKKHETLSICWQNALTFQIANSFSFLSSKIPFFWEMENFKPINVFHLDND